MWYYNMVILPCQYSSLCYTVCIINFSFLFWCIQMCTRTQLRDTEFPYCFLENALECAWGAVLCETWAALLAERVEVCFKEYVVILGVAVHTLNPQESSSNCQNHCSMSSKQQWWAGLSPGRSVLCHFTKHFGRVQRGFVWEAR